MYYPEDENDLTLDDLVWAYDHGEIVLVRNLTHGTLGTLIVNPIPATPDGRTVNAIRSRFRLLKDC